MLFNLEGKEMRREELIRKGKRTRAPSWEVMRTRCCPGYVRTVLSQLWRGPEFTFSGIQNGPSGHTSCLVFPEDQRTLW